MAFSETEILNKYKHEKWFKKWAGDALVHDFAEKRSAIYDFENDEPLEFVQAVIDKKLSFSWHFDEKSIHMPRWVHIEDGTDNSCGEIKELPGTDWSYCVVDYFNYCLTQGLVPHQIWPNQKALPIWWLFHSFKVVAEKHIFRLTGKRTDASTVEDFHSKHAPAQGVGINTNKHAIQFGGYTMDYRGSSDLSADVCPGLKILIGIRTSVLNELPDDFHLLGGSPSLIDSENLDFSKSIVVKVEDIEDDFQRIADVFNYYDKVRLESGIKYKVEPSDVDLKKEAEDIITFGKDLKGYASAAGNNLLEIMLTKKSEISHIFKYEPIGEYNTKGKSLGTPAGISVIKRLDSAPPAKKESGYTTRRELLPPAKAPSVPKRTLHYLIQLHGGTNGFDPQLEFAKFEKPDIGKPTKPWQAFVEEYTHFPKITKIETLSDHPEAHFKKLQKLDSKPEKTEEELQALEDSFNEPNWHQSYLDWRKQYTENTASDFFQNLPKKPKRLRLRDDAPYFQDVYAEVLNQADVQRLAIELIRCLNPESWLEILCHWVFKQGTPSMDTIIEGMQKTGLLDLMSAAMPELIKEIAESVEKEKLIKDSEYKELALERKEYEEEIAELEIALLETEDLEKQKKIEAEIDHLEGKKQLIYIDETTTKWNASAGSVMPMDEGDTEAMKKVASQMSEAIATLNDPQLKDKICKNIIEYSAKALELLRQLFADDDEGPKKRKRKRLTKDNKDKAKKKKESSEDLGDKITEYLRQAAAKAAATVVLFLVKKILTELIELCEYYKQMAWDAVLDDGDSDSKIPGLVDFKDLLSENPDSTAAAMAKTLDQYDLGPADVNDLLGLMKDMELLFSQVELCGLFYGKPSSSVLNVIKNLIRVRYVGIFNILKQDDGNCITDATVIDFFSSFKDYIDDDFCANLGGSSAKDLDFGVCPPLPNILNLKEDLCAGIATPEQCAGTLNQAAMDYDDLLDWAIDMAVGDPPKPPAAFCTPQEEGLLPHDPHPIDYLNDMAFDQIFEPLEASFRAELGTFLGRYMGGGNTSGTNDAIQGAQSIEDLKDLSDGTVGAPKKSSFFATLYDSMVDPANIRHWPHTAGEIGQMTGIDHYGGFLQNSYEFNWSDTTMHKAIEKGPKPEEGKIILSLVPRLYGEGSFMQVITKRARLGFTDAGTLVSDLPVEPDLRLWYHIDNGKLINFRESEINRYLKGDLPTSFAFTEATQIYGLPPTRLLMFKIPDKLLKSSVVDDFADILINQMLGFHAEGAIGDDFREKLSELYDSVMTLNVLESMAKTFSLIYPSVPIEDDKFIVGKSFWSSYTIVSKLFNKMIPKTVYTLEDNCHPKNDTSILKVGAAKDYAKKRNDELACADFSPKKAFQPSNLGISSAEGLVLTLSRLYALEASLRILPLVWHVDLKDCFRNDATVTYIVDKMIEDLTRTDRQSQVVTQKALYKNRWQPTETEIEYSKDGLYGGYYVENPPLPATIPPLGEQFQPKYHSHIIQTANSLMLTRAEKGGEVIDPLNGETYTPEDFKDLYSRNGLKYLLKENIVDISKFYKEGLESFDVQNNPLYLWWLKRIEGFLAGYPEALDFEDYMPLMNHKSYTDGVGRFYKAHLDAENNVQVTLNTQAQYNYKRGNFVLEPYVKIRQTKEIKNQDGNDYVAFKYRDPEDGEVKEIPLNQSVYISLKEFEEGITKKYLGSLFEGSNILISHTEFFDPWEFGLRLTYVFPLGGQVEGLPPGVAENDFFDVTTPPEETWSGVGWTEEKKEVFNNLILTQNQEVVEKLAEVFTPDGNFNTILNNSFVVKERFSFDLEDEAEDDPDDFVFDPDANEDSDKAKGESPPIYCIPLTEVSIPVPSFWAGNAVQPENVPLLQFYNYGANPFNNISEPVVSVFTNTDPGLAPYPEAEPGKTQGKSIKQQLFELLIENIKSQSGSTDEGFFKKIFDLETVLGCFTLYTLEHSYATNIFESVEAGDLLGGAFTTQSTYNTFDSTKQAIRVYFYTVYLAQNATHDSSWFDLMGLLEWLRWPGGKCGSLGGFAASMGATVPPNVSQIAGVTPILILKGLVTLIDPRWCKWPWTLTGWIMKAIKEMGLDFNWLPPYSDSTAEDKVCPPGVEFEEEEKAIEAVPIIGNTGFEAPPSYDGHGGLFSYWWKDNPVQPTHGYVQRHWRYHRWIHLPQELQERWWKFEKQRLLGFPEPPPYYNDWKGDVDKNRSWGSSAIWNSNNAKTGQINFWTKYMVHRTTLITSQGQGPSAADQSPGCAVEDVGGPSAGKSGWFDKKYYHGKVHPVYSNVHPCATGEQKWPTWEDMILWQGWNAKFMGHSGPGYMWPGYERGYSHLYGFLPTQYMFNRHYGFFKHKDFKESWRNTLSGLDAAEYIWYAWALGGPREFGFPTHGALTSLDEKPALGEILPADRTSGQWHEGPDRDRNFKLLKADGTAAPISTIGGSPESYNVWLHGFGLPLYYNANWGMNSNDTSAWEKRSNGWGAYGDEWNQHAEDWYTLF